MSTSTLSFRAIFVLASFVFVSSALNIHNVVKSNKVYTLNAANRAMMKLTKSGEPEDSNFNGDLFVGERDPNDDVYSFSVELENQSSSVYNTFVPVKVEAGIFPWVALVNEKGSSAVFCGPVDGSINTSYANFTVRINPESKAVFRVYCTIHDA